MLWQGLLLVFSWAVSLISPVVPACRCPQAWPLDWVLYLTASAENGSEHPLARALLSYAAVRLDGGAAVLQEQPAALAGLADSGGTASPAALDGEAAGNPTGAGMQAALLASRVSWRDLPACLPACLPPASTCSASFRP